MHPGVILRAILDAAAAYERELIRARTRAAMAVKRAKGERSGKIPYGLTLAEDGRHLVENGFEQSVIARVKALRAEGHAVTRIAKALDAPFGARSEKKREPAVTAPRVRWAPAPAI